MSNILFPLSRDILLARDSIVGITIPSSISLPASTLYSYRNTSSPVTKLISHLLASDIGCVLPSGPRVYLFVTWRKKFQSRFMQLNMHFPKYLKNTFMITLVRCDG